MKKNYESVEEIVADLRFEDSDKINDALQISASLLDGEDRRRSELEKKATILVEAAGLSVTIVVALSTALVEKRLQFGDTIFVIISFLYLATTSLIFSSIFRALQALNIPNFPVTELNPDDIFELNESSLDSVRKERVASMFWAIGKNTAQDNRKATYIISAQTLFRLGMTFFWGMATLILWSIGFPILWNSISTGVLIDLRFYLLCLQVVFVILLVCYQLGMTWFRRG